MKTTTFRGRSLTLIAIGFLLTCGLPVRADDLATLQQDYVDQHYGMFLHYNMETYTYPALGGQDPNLFTLTTSTANPTGSIEVATDQWAAVAKAAGMTYGVLTTKHHDGFPVWDSNQTTHDIASTTWYSNSASPNYHVDVVQSYADSFRAQGLNVGLYYSVWDRTAGIGPRNEDGDPFPPQLSDAQATAYVKAEIGQLLTSYGDINVLWTDGWGWQVGYTKVNYAEVYAYIKSISPDTLLMENNTWHSLTNSDIIGYESSLPPAGNTLPTEACATINGNWFYSTNPLKSASTIAGEINYSNSNNSAYLLDIPPDQSGMIQANLMQRLMEVKALLPAWRTWNNGAGNMLWNTASTNWGGTTLWNNAEPDSALFAATGAGTVTLGTNITADRIMFNPGATGYNIAGGGYTLTLTGGVTANENAAISANLALTGTGAWNAGTGKTLTASGTVTRNAGATVDFSTTGTFNGSGLRTAVGATVGGGTSGVAWATIGGTDWAVDDGSKIAALSSYYTTTSGGNTAGNYAGKDVNVTSSPTLGGPIAPNSLRFNSAGANTVTLTGTNTITSGGILVTSNVGNNISTITGGTLRGAPGKELLVVQNNTTKDLTISSVIADNGSATGLTKTGPGTLTLTTAATYTGPTVITGGTLALRPAPTAPPVAGYARWFDASTPANLVLESNGTTVNQWNDLSGNNAHATPLVSGDLDFWGQHNPAYVSDALNGKGAIHFVGGNNVTLGPANTNLMYATDNSIRTYFAIFKGSSFLATAKLYDYPDAGAGPYDFHRVGSDTDPTAPLWDGTYASANITTGTTYVNGAVVNGTTFNMPTAANNGFNLVAVSTTGPVTANGFNRDRMYHSGDQYQAEVIIYDTQLTADQIQQVQRYLNAKWGLGISSLPAYGSNADLLPTTTALTIAANATLDLGGCSQQIGSLADAVPGSTTGHRVLLGTGKLTVGDATSTTFSGAISSTGSPVTSLDKVGTGALTLAGVNTYEGATNVKAGTLLVNNTSGSGTGTGAVTVDSGATLGGTGTIGGTVNVLTGGTLAPGASVGTLAVGGDLEFADGGNNWVAELFGAAADRVDVTGTLTLGDNTALEFVFNAANPFKAGTYTLATSGTLVGTFSSVTSLNAYAPTGVVYGANAITIQLLADLLAGDANMDRNTNALDYVVVSNNYNFGSTWAEGDVTGDGAVNALDYVVISNNYGSHVPEPATLAMLGLGGLSVLLRRKRR